MPFRNVLNNGSGNRFVNISAYWSFVEMRCTRNVPLRTCSLKWWYLTAMCFVLGRFLGTLASSSQAVLSSNILAWQFTSTSGMPTASCTSLSNCFKWISSRHAVLSAMYSLSVVLRAISVCSLLAHSIGQPKYRITYPDRLTTDAGLSASSEFHIPTYRRNRRRHSSRVWSEICLVSLSCLYRRFRVDICLCALLLPHAICTD